MGVLNGQLSPLMHMEISYQYEIQFATFNLVYWFKLK